MGVIDLSLPIDNERRGVEISIARRLESDGWNATALELYSDCGTHMDAPRHLLAGGATLEQQPLDMAEGELD